MASAVSCHDCLNGVRCNWREPLETQISNGPLTHNPGKPRLILYERHYQRALPERSSQYALNYEGTA